MSFQFSAAPPLEATALHEAFMQAEGPTLDMWLTLLNATLRQLPSDAPKERYAMIMRLMTKLTRRREDAELAADPARRAGIERVGEHFARKAQSGFSPHPLPE